MERQFDELEMCLQSLVDSSRNMCMFFFAVQPINECGYAHLSKIKMRWLGVTDTHVTRKQIFRITYHMSIVIIIGPYDA